MAETLIEEIILKVSVDDSGAGNALNNYSNAANKADKSSSMLSQTTKILGGVIAAIGFKELVKDAFNVSLEYDKINQSLKTVTGSQSAANKEFNFLADTADRLGVTIPSLAGGYTKLFASMQGAGLGAEVTRELASATAELSTAMGLSAAETDGISRALSQIASKGKLSTEELLQLAERGVDAFGLASRAIGVTTGEMTKMLAKGEILSDDFLPKFGAQMRKEFGQAAADAANSAQANINRLSNEWDKALTGMGNATQKFIPILTSLVKSFNSVQDAASETIEGLNLWVDELLGVADRSGEADDAAIKAGRQRKKAAEESKKLADQLAKEKAETEALTKERKAFSQLGALGQKFINAEDIKRISEALGLTKQEIETLRPAMQAALSQGIDPSKLQGQLKNFVTAFKEELNQVEILPEEPLKGPFDAMINKALELENALNMAKVLGLNKREFEKLGTVVLNNAAAGKIEEQQLRKQIDLLRKKGFFAEQEKKKDAVLPELVGTTIEAGTAAATEFLKQSEIDIQRNTILEKIAKNTEKSSQDQITVK